MRILHFSEAFSSLSETFIYDSYAGQVRSGLDVHLATLKRVDEAARPAERVRLLALPGRSHPTRIFAQILGMAQRLPVWERPFPVYAHGLREEVLRLRPDLVHAHFGTAGVIAETACRGLRVPFVVTLYGHDISRLPREARWRARYESMFERAASIAVLSKDMQRTALREGARPERTHVIHLARALDGLTFRERAGNVRKWASIGRFVEKKGFDDTIRAVALLREREVAVQLDILGDGPLLPAMVRLVGELGLQNVVKFRGAVPNQQAIQALSEADAFILSSKTASNADQEGTPTVLIEAQALGLPCVSTRHAGIPEMLPAAAQGLLASEGSVPEIATRMEQLMRMSAEARGELARAGRRHVELEFSLDAQVKRYAALYEDVSARDRGQPT